MNFLRKRNNIRFLILALLVGLFFTTATITVTSQPKPAEAICCSSCCMCLISTIFADILEWVNTWIQINLHLYLSFIMHQMIWFDWTFWQQYMLPTFQMMGAQLSSVGAQQIMVIGMFMDAQNQLESQRLMQEMQARIHKDYHPSRGMCEFGTRVMSLAASERKGELSSLLLSERSSDRYLGNKSTFSAQGTKQELYIRFNAFKETYCNQYNNNENLDVICPPPTTTLTAAQNRARRARLNRDIDYQRVIENPWTVDFNLTSDANAPSDMDKDIMALSDNLYGFESFSRVVPPEGLQNKVDQPLTGLQSAYLDMRAVVAKTKVAENSFNAIVSLKSEGTPGSRQFIEAYLRELGVQTSQIDELLGQNPSYYAQMEILTKKAYQTPIFYTNLYDKPANIDRKETALQAISLMQKFDMWKSYLRTEASLSILLELTVENMQREVEEQIRSFNKTGSIR